MLWKYWLFLNVVVEDGPRTWIFPDQSEFAHWWQCWFEWTDIVILGIETTFRNWHSWFSFSSSPFQESGTEDAATSKGNSNNQESTRSTPKYCPRSSPVTQNVKCNTSLVASTVILTQVHHWLWHVQTQQLFKLLYRSNGHDPAAAQYRDTTAAQWWHLKLCCCLFSIGCTKLSVQYICQWILIVQIYIISSLFIVCPHRLWAVH